MSPHPQNPRLPILKRDAEQVVIKPFRSHGWEAHITHEHQNHSSIEIEASKKDKSVRIALVYSTATANKHYKLLSERCDHIFFHGSNYRLEEYTKGIETKIDSINDFFPFLVNLNKEIEPDRTPEQIARRPKRIRRITDENPSQAIIVRLSQFTSKNLARKLVVRRAEESEIHLSDDAIDAKAEGVAFSLQNALDYFHDAPKNRLNNRILGAYYGTVAFAFAEMLASPTGALDLDEVEGMTKQGHGLYSVQGNHGGFSDLTVGVLATGFLPRWITKLGYDTSCFPRKKAKVIGDLEKVDDRMFASLQELFSSIPEINELYAEVFDGKPRWIIPSHSLEDNASIGLHGSQKEAGSTYARFIDYSCKLTASDLEQSGWPLAEIMHVHPEIERHNGQEFRARVDHVGFDRWWDVIPTHSSPFQHRTTALLPTIGGLRDYRVIATTILYALSIMVRYMPSAWRQIEGGEEDQFLALINASLNVWERLLPEEFLKSIAGEQVYATQPGSLFS